MTPAEQFNRICSEKSDINEHLQFLSESARGIQVTEFGVRTGLSTMALLFGRPTRLVSYDFWPCKVVPRLEKFAAECKVEFTFICHDVLTVEIENTDLLFIDTLHDYFQLHQELQRHAQKVRPGGLIIIHDTTTFGESGETSSVGLWPAITDFLEVFENQWRLVKRYENNNGLTVLQRL